MRTIDSPRSGAGLIGQLLFLRPAWPGKVLLVVEGETDKRLFTNFISENSCKIIEAKGQENITFALQDAVVSADPLVIAVLDADFRHLDGQPAPPKCFLTDFHDIEMMMFASPALEKVLREHGSEEKLVKIVEKGKDVRQRVLEAAADLACLRWLSLQQRYDYTFEGLAFSGFISRDTLTADRISTIRTVKNKSNKPQIPETHLAGEIEEIRKQSHDLRQLCNGHDVCEALNLGLTKVFGSLGKAIDSEAALRLAYEYEFFRQSQLYAAIAAWAATQRVTVWRAAA